MDMDTENRIVTPDLSPRIPTLSFPCARAS